MWFPGVQNAPHFDYGAGNGFLVRKVLIDKKTIASLARKCPCSLTDKASASGAENGCSIQPRGTVSIFGPELEIEVRLLSRAQNSVDMMWIKELLITLDRFSKKINIRN